MARHGSLEDLEPIPSMDPADPYNWSTGRVRIHPRPACYDILLTGGLESNQLGIGGLPCNDGVFHGIGDPVRIC